MSGATTSAPSGSSLAKRALNFTIQLGTGSFGQTGFNTVKLTGLRTRVTVQKQGSPGFGMASAQIYGVVPSVMNQVSTLGVPIPIAAGRNNTVTIEAGDVGGLMSVIFKGNISYSWQMLDNQPDTYLDIEAISGAFDAMAPAAPISVNGQADVATMMSSLALQMNRTFENNGVQVQLSNPYYSGTAIAQAQAICRDAHIEMHDDGTTLAIWPRSGTRGGTIPLISPNSGLVGYPAYTGQGIKFRTIFSPAITFGGNIQMQSSLLAACGKWYVNDLMYDLASEMPDGPWFCQVGAVRQDGVPKA